MENHLTLASLMLQNFDCNLMAEDNLIGLIEDLVLILAF